MHTHTAHRWRSVRRPVAISTLFPWRKRCGYQQALALREHFLPTSRGVARTHANVTYTIARYELAQYAAFVMDGFETREAFRTVWCVTAAVFIGKDAGWGTANIAG